MGISTAERLRFKRRTSHVPNLMHKLLKFIFTCKHFRPLNIVKMNWVRLIKFDVWINRRTCVIWVDLIGHFRVPKSLVVKMSFNYDANKTHFHNKGFALSLVLKLRFFGTRKWPIPQAKMSPIPESRFPFTTRKDRFSGCPRVLWPSTR